MEKDRNKRKELMGTVLTAKMQKTVVVAVKRKVVHPKYHKRIERVKKYYAHSEESLSPGDNVVLMETKPISKLKRWRVKEVLKKREGDI